MLDLRIFVYFDNRGRFRNKSERNCRPYTVDVYQNPTELEIFLKLDDFPI